MIAMPLVFTGLFDFTPAFAACDPGGASGFSSGSAVVGNQVVVCANNSANSLSNSTKTSPGKITSKKPASVASKPSSCPTSVTTTAEIVAAALRGCTIPGPSRPPTKVTILPPKTIATKSQVASLSSDQAAFTPDQVAIHASQTKFHLDETVLLSSSAKVHERSAVILGRIGYVQFVPSAYRWLAENNWVLGSPVFAANFKSIGSKTVNLSVDYEASYRFSLTEPWQKIGLVTVEAQMLLEVIQAPAPLQVRSMPLLVWSSCATHPSAYRC